VKRLAITPLVIGVPVTLVVGGLHVTKSMAGLENAAAQLVADYAGATRVVADKWQYVFVLLIALGVAWLTLSKVPRWHSRLLLGLLLVDLIGLAWFCSLYRVFYLAAPSV